MLNRKWEMRLVDVLLNKNKYILRYFM